MPKRKSVVAEQREVSPSPTRRKYFHSWEDLETFTNEIGALLQSIKPCIAKEAFDTLQSIFHKIEESLVELRNRDTRIVLSGPQGTMKTDLLNGFLCGNVFLTKDGIRTKPLISRPGGQSVTSVPLEVKHADEYALTLEFCDESVLRERCRAEEIPFEPVSTKNLLPAMKKNWNLERQMDAIHAVLETIPGGLTPVEQLGLTLIKLQGPFPWIPEQVVFVDTPGFGHTSEADPDGEKTKKILLGEFRKMDAIFAVLPRAADPELIKTFYNLGALHERQDQIPLLVSVFREERMDDKIVEQDLQTLRRSIAAAGNSLLYDAVLPLEADIYSHQRVFNYLTANATLFQRSYYAENRDEFHTKIKDIQQIVKQMDMEVFALNASSFLSTCRAAIKGRPANAQKLNDAFAAVKRTAEPVFWPSKDYTDCKLGNAQNKVIKKVTKLFLSNEMELHPAQLTQAVTEFFRSHLNVVVQLGFEYVTHFLLQFSRSYDAKVDSSTAEGYFVPSESVSQEEDADSDTFKWFSKLRDTVGINTKDHFMRTNVGSATARYVEYNLRILRGAIEKAVKAACDELDQMEQEEEQDDEVSSYFDDSISEILGSDSDEEVPGMDDTDLDDTDVDEVVSSEDEYEDSQTSVEVSGQSPSRSTQSSPRSSGVVSAFHTQAQARRAARIERVMQYANNVVTKIIESQTYLTVQSRVMDESNAILDRVKDCVKKFNETKLKEEQKKELDDKILKYLDKLRDVLRQRYKEVHVTLPDEDATNPLPRPIPVNELAQMIIARAGKRALKKPQVLVKPKNISISENAHCDPRVLTIPPHGTTVEIHPDTLQQIRLHTSQYTPQSIINKKFIFPMFIVSWVPSQNALSMLNFTFPAPTKQSDKKEDAKEEEKKEGDEEESGKNESVKKGKRGQREKKEEKEPEKKEEKKEEKKKGKDMDGLPHLTFVVVEKSQKKWYLDHLKGHPSVYVVVLPQDDVSTHSSLNICKTLAEEFGFLFWWRAAHHIHSMHQFMRSTFKSRRCSLARGMLYAEHVMCSLYVHLFSAIATLLKKNMVAFIRMISLAHKITKRKSVEDGKSQGDGKLHSDTSSQQEDGKSQDDGKAQSDEESEGDDALTDEQAQLVDEFLLLAEDEDGLDQPAIALRMVDYLRDLMPVTAIHRQYINTAKKEDTEKRANLKKKVADLQQVTSACVGHANMVRRCTMVTFVASKEQLRGIWRLYPKEYCIIAHRAGFNDLVLNSTLAQRNFWFGSMELGDMPEKHVDLPTFEAQIAKAEQSLANKLLKHEHNGISLVNFSRMRLPKKALERPDSADLNNNSQQTDKNKTPVKKKLFSKNSKNNSFQPKTKKEEGKGKESKKGKEKGKGSKKGKEKEEEKASAKRKERKEKGREDNGGEGPSKKSKR